MGVVVMKQKSCDPGVATRASARFVAINRLRQIGPARYRESDDGCTYSVRCDVDGKQVRDFASAREI